MEKKALLIDYGFCSGCHSCELACRMEHNLKLDEWGIRVLEDGPRMNRDASIYWDYVPHITDMCDGCVERTSEGLDPLCVQTCLGKVMYYGTVSEMAAKMLELGKKAMVYILNEDVSYEFIEPEMPPQNPTYHGEHIKFSSATEDDPELSDGFWYLWRFSLGSEWELMAKSETRDEVQAKYRELAIQKAAMRDSNSGEDYLLKITNHVPTAEEKESISGKVNH